MYKNWDVIWSSGNVVEIETDLVNELIEACVWCIEDKRFSNITIIDFENVKIRIDLIENRAILTKQKIIKCKSFKFMSYCYKKRLY